jgi:ComF family protein
MAQATHALLTLARRMLRAPCMGCGRYGKGQALCASCTARLAATPWGVSTLTIDETCIPVLWREAYGGPLTDIIYSAKYRGQWASARLLGQCLGRLPPPWLGTPPSAVPVPMTAQRLASRGFSQSQLIAAEAARHWRIAHHHHWLTKWRHTERQASLAKNERAINIQHSFAGRAALAGQRIVLIDDIMTSGATLREAVRAIRQAGGTVIAAAVIAKVNDHGARKPSARRPKALHVQRRAR